MLPFILAKQNDLKQMTNRIDLAAKAAGRDVLYQQADLQQSKQEGIQTRNSLGQTNLKIQRLEASVNLLTRNQLDDSRVRLQLKSVQEREASAAKARLGKKDIEIHCLAALAFGNVFLYGDDAAALSGATVTAAAAGDALAVLTFQLTALLEDGSRALHVGWPEGLPLDITFAEFVANGNVNAPVQYYYGMTPPAVVGGTATWGVAAWAVSTAYSLNDVVTNSGNTYICTTAGTSDSSGGPSGTRTGIADNTAVWKFLGYGTDAVLLTDSTGVNGGSGISADSNGQWFKVQTVEQDVAAVLWNPLGLTLPSGVLASSVGVFPGLGAAGTLTVTVVLDTDGGTKVYADGDYIDATVDMSALTKGYDLSWMVPHTSRIPFIA